MNHSRPDILFDLCQLSSIVKPATVRDLLSANKLVSKIKIDRTVLRFNKLELSNLQLICYNDLSFGNLVSGGSQGGFIIYISDNTGFAVPVMWSSHKSKCVVKSAMAAETLFKVDGAESTFWLKMIYQKLFHVDMVKTIIPIICCTDSRQLYDAVHSICGIEDRQLRMEIALLHEMLDKDEVSQIEWVEGPSQLADCLTKLGYSYYKHFQKENL